MRMVVHLSMQLHSNAWYLSGGYHNSVNPAHALSLALTFPGLASPVVLGDQLYNMTTGGGVADQHTRSTWHGIVQEGDYVDMRVPV
jgi:hypothetical protein